MSKEDVIKVAIEWLKNNAYKYACNDSNYEPTIEVNELIEDFTTFMENS